MENATMGKVLVSLKIQNLTDLINVRAGQRSADQIRTLEVDDALVDTSASMLSMPKRLIDQLGLVSFNSKKVRTCAGPATVDLYGAVRITIMDREWSGDVMEVPDDCPILVGQIVLEALDFVVDMSTHKLIGNPANGGEHILDLY